MITAPERRRIVNQLLSAALEREPSERSAYLDQVCTEPSVRQEVESLIAAHAQTKTLFPAGAAAGPTGLAPGVTLGTYEIVALLGAGGMGTVYQAKDTRLRRQVALKILPPSFADSDALVRFRREAEMLASLSHPNIVTVYEIGREREISYISMELVEGKVLSDVLRARRMSMEDVLDIATQIVQGLVVAHRARVVHRDLKPKNIMIRRDGLVKILDFGLSKLTPDFERSLLDQTTALTAPNAILGTVDYMSPQQAAGLPVDFRSDQFSFGSVAYEMATGKQPFRRKTAAQTLAAIIEDEPTPVRSLNPHVTPAWDAIIRRCLRKDPAQRYASTDDLAGELRQQREQVPPRRQLIRRSWTLAAVIVFTCLLAAGGTWTVASHFRERIRMWPLSVHTEATKQLAVLPFTNIGNDPANQAFCDGLVQILSSRLSQLQQFQKTIRVVPASDVVEEGIVSVREARQAFGVNLAITGSIQRTENRVRITINLVDPRELRQLKSETIDTQVRDISTLQDGVVLKASQLLNIPLTTQAQQQLANGGTTVPDAYQYYAQGQGYLQRYEIAQNLDTAASLFKLALQQDPKYALAEAGLGEAYWRKYELTKDTRWADEAQTHAEAALKLNDKLAEVYSTLGMIHSGTGRYDEAIQDFQKAQEIDPINPDAYRGLAKTYQEMGRQNDSESTYLRAIAARPNYWGFHNDLGGLYFHSGRYDEAEKQFQIIVQLTPDNARGYNNLGAVAYAQKRYQEAAKMFEKAVAIKPTAPALSNLGTIYYTLGQYPEAARYYEQAIRLDGDETQYWHNLAAAYEWSNQPDKARAAFRRTAELAENELRVNPDDASVLILLADAYSMLNQAQRARQVLQRGLDLAPNDVSNAFQASVVYEQLGDRQLALKWLGDAIRKGFSRDLIEKEPSLAKLRLDPGYQALFTP